MTRLRANALLLIAALIWISILIAYPQIIAPVLACLVLAASLTACACQFSNHRRNIDDK